MTLQVWTASLAYRGADYLDVSEASADRARRLGWRFPGAAWAPSREITAALDEARRVFSLGGDRAEEEAAWKLYREAYRLEMRASYGAHRLAWEELLARCEVTLVCECRDLSRCHLGLLASYFGKLGAVVQGERSIVPHPSARWDFRDSRSRLRWPGPPVSAIRSDPPVLSPPPTPLVSALPRDVTLSGRELCSVCCRRLRVPISCLTGIGPVCAAALGIDRQALLAEQEGVASRYPDLFRSLRVLAYYRTIEAARLAIEQAQTVGLDALAERIRTFHRVLQTAPPSPPALRVDLSESTAREPLALTSPGSDVLN